MLFSFEIKDCITMGTLSAFPVDFQATLCHVHSKMLVMHDVTFTLSNDLYLISVCILN